jgi:hypothetical protein
MEFTSSPLINASKRKADDEGLSLKKLAVKYNPLLVSARKQVLIKRNPQLVNASKRSVDEDENLAKRRKVKGPNRIPGLRPVPIKRGAEDDKVFKRRRIEMPVLTDIQKIASRIKRKAAYYQHESKRQKGGFKTMPDWILLS